MIKDRFLRYFALKSWHCWKAEESCIQVILNISVIFSADNTSDGFLNFCFAFKLLMKLSAREMLNLMRLC